MGTTAMVARRVGEKDTNGAAVSGVQAIYLAFFVSILIGNSRTYIFRGKGFTKLMLGSNLIITFLKEI